MFFNCPPDGIDIRQINPGLHIDLRSVPFTYEPCHPHNIDVLLHLSIVAPCNYDADRRIISAHQIIQQISPHAAKSDDHDRYFLFRYMPLYHLQPFL